MTSSASSAPWQSKSAPKRVVEDDLSSGESEAEMSSDFSSDDCGAH